jgi:hypothetical protein
MDGGEIHVAGERRQRHERQIAMEHVPRSTRFTGSRQCRRDEGKT